MTTENVPAIVEIASANIMTAEQFDASIAEAQAKAQTLKRLVESQGLFAMISGKQYLEVEAWQTIGRAYGLTAKTVWTRAIPGGGWEARVAAVTGDGTEVGAAETECGTPGDAPWDKRNSAQQRSMAQTRAVSKALRSVLSWVVVLAGYEATPASEMPRGNSGGSGKATKTVTEPQLKRLWAKAQGQGIPADDIQAYVREQYDCAIRDLTMAQYDEVCAWLEASQGQGD